MTPPLYPAPRTQERGRFSLCRILPQTKSGKTLLPPFLKPSAIDHDGTVALLTAMFTAEAQLVVGNSAGFR